MKITNKHGLPETFIRALKKGQENYEGKNYDDYISVTNLLDDPHIRYLRQKYSDKIEVDVTDRIWILFGSALHKIMESGARERDLIEERLFENFGDWIINGAFDYYDSETKTVYDYKTTSVWTYIYGDRFEKWQKQLDIYAWLLRCANFQVNNIANILLFKDYKKSKASRKDDYPDAPVEVVEYDTQNQADTEIMMAKNLNRHEEYTAGIGKCQAEHRWKDEDKWAVHKALKSGNGYYKNANRVLKNEKEARKYGNDHYDDYIIKFREGKSNRCTPDYCNVAEFCPFYNNEIKEK